MPLRLPVVLPVILALTFLADGITRALPVGGWTFRPWEAMVANHPPTGPFEPSARYDSPRSSGDLANMGNLGSMRVFRRETFTTDAYGYRNPPGRAESGTVSVLLLGDSFAAGSGVADDLTLSGQLTGTWGRTTYNLAPWLPRRTMLVAFARMLKMKPGDWVVHQQTYPYNESNAFAAEPVRYSSVTAFDRFKRSFTSEIWPLRIIVNRLWKSLEDDVLLPNPFGSTVHRARLDNGDEMVFFASDMAAFHTAGEGVAPDTVAAVAESTDYVKGLADEAHQLGLRYLVVLVPVKMATYRHLLVPPLTDGPRVPGTIAEMERQLRTAGVPVLNLFSEFASRATADAVRHQYLYWPDDTHWSPLGISIAARAIAGVMAEGRTDPP